MRAGQREVLLRGAAAQRAQVVGSAQAVPLRDLEAALRPEAEAQRSGAVLARVV